MAKESFESGAREDKRGAKIAARCNGAAAPSIRDRIRELRRVSAKELLSNPKNWRRHPKAQVDALRGLLTEIGYADALIARELPDGQLQLIDGHLRAETTPDIEVPVLVLDVTEEEADKLLLTLDPLAAMAESDSARIQTLLETVRTDNEAVEHLIRLTAGERSWAIVHPDEFNPAEVPLERADELRNKWGTEVGQLWRIEQHRVICGDSTDPIAVKRLWSDDGPPARMIWTDAPYGVSYGEKTISNNRHGYGRGRRPIETTPCRQTSYRSCSLPRCVLRANTPWLARSSMPPSRAFFSNISSRASRTVVSPTIIV